MATRSNERDLESEASGAVMLSYSWGSKDEQGSYPQQQLVLLMKRQGYKVWMDTEMMRNDMFETMGTVIKHCAAVVACISPSYHTRGGNAELELKAARFTGKVIAPVKTTRNTDMHNVLGTYYGFAFNCVIYRDVSSDFEAGMAQVVGDLEKNDVPRSRST
eukprot:TRINITY_DN11481_c0_g1_i1.p2 TRINITY_DN11481_c0_g1~~TRINITY_DN11481_c0_g1_i1.p2  ORF type:complete len:161 (+),score=43.25 TRINITY_DN11481_c0_g1_i1:1602-2084(+)